MDRFVIPESVLPFGIHLKQTGLDQFAVAYGFQLREGLTYGQACKELGQCIMHALSCEGVIDNRTKEEARAGRDRKPYYNADAIIMQAAA